MLFIIGLVIVAVIIYFAFIRDENDTQEQTFKKIARTIIALFVVIVIAFIILMATYDM